MKIVFFYPYRRYSILFVIVYFLGFVACDRPGDSYLVNKNNKKEKSEEELKREQGCQALLNELDQFYKNSGNSFTGCNQKYMSPIENMPTNNSSGKSNVYFVLNFCKKVKDLISAGVIGSGSSQDYRYFRNDLLALMEKVSEKSCILFLSSLEPKSVLEVVGKMTKKSKTHDPDGYSEEIIRLLSDAIVFYNGDMYSLRRIHAYQYEIVSVMHVGDKQEDIKFDMDSY